MIGYLLNVFGRFTAFSSVWDVSLNRPTAANREAAVWVHCSMWLHVEGRQKSMMVLCLHSTFKKPPCLSLLSAFCIDIANSCSIKTQLTFYLLLTLCPYTLSVMYSIFKPFSCVSSNTHSYLKVKYYATASFDSVLKTNSITEELNNLIHVFRITSRVARASGACKTGINSWKEKVLKLVGWFALTYININIKT